MGASPEPGSPSEEGNRSDGVPPADAADGGGVHTLFPGAYDRLRGLACRLLQAERFGRLLQATALVHEAFVRLSERERRYQSESELLAIAAAQMRQVLVDHARRGLAAKRGGGEAPLTLDSQVLGLASRPPFELVDVDDAIARLTALDQRQGRLVELHLFGALSIEEAAELLGISARTAFNDWRAARAWLLKELAP